MHYDTKTDDSSLIEACMRRDPAAWTEFVKKYSGLISISITSRLRRYGFRISGEEVEDIRQSILTSLWEGEKFESVRDRKSVAGWLAIVSGNTAIAYMRKKLSGGDLKFVPITDEAEIENLLPARPQDDPFDETYNIDKISEAIKTSIASLPAKEQLILKLNLFHDMKYYEIAEMLIMPKGTVASHIKRGREKLKRLLKDFR